MFNKMNKFLNLFLEVHQLPMIESEGVLIRGRSFYKTRGYHKIENLIKNHRCTVKGGANVFITFFSLLKLSLEETYNKKIRFAWFDKDESFAEELLDINTIFG